MTNAIRWSVRILGITTVIVASATFAQEEKAPAVNLDSDLAKQSYTAGVNVGRSVSQSGMEFDIDAFIAGFKAAYADQELALSDEEFRAASQGLQAAMQAAQQAKMAASNAEGAAYLAENAKKEGVVTTESGLQYKVIEEGEGPSPTAEDTVKVHYTGTFIDGEKFDSSVDRGEPAVFGVGGVIPGWTEALQLMKVGAKWELAIPSDLAYGPGRPGIPPNSVLLFEVELLEIVE